MERIEELYVKYREDRLSSDEKVEFFNLIQSAKEDSLKELANRYLDAQVPNDLAYLNDDAERIRLAIREKIAAEHTRPTARINTWIKLTVAAAALLTCVFFIYRYSNKELLDSENQKAQLINDLAPGSNRATLTLADGRTIVLDSIHAGQLAMVSGTEISKTADGELVYQDQAPTSTEVQTNTVSIPRGGEYRLTLPDGTRVWLNAATQIEYPTRFNAAERRVKVLGEAYFEVTKDASHPFIVETDGQEIKVLGTHFNVNTYNTGKTVTTLEEGSVKVSSSGATQLLKPGQQSILFNGSFEVANADMESALAWKNGLLFFRDAPLQSVLAEVSRWYDVDIQYNGKPTQELFTGSVSRASNLSAMLRILKLTGVKTKLVAEGNSRKLIIEP